ncbi:unnamed protein product [Symbiodinium sp. CCMP2592]|nr:unnamed protein product [Symbiodinium sp. CCMP2592]
MPDSFRGVQAELVLGVDEDADEDEWQKAYQDRQRDCDPSRVPAETSEAAEEVLQALEFAYDFMESRADAADAQPVVHHVQEIRETGGAAFSPAVFRSLFVPRSLPGSLEERADEDVIATLAHVGPTWVLPIQEFIFTLIHEVSVSHVRDAVSALPARAAVAFWIREQNAVLHIERRSRDVARLSAWRVQLPLAQAMLSEPCCMQLPAAATDVSWGVVDHEDFYRLVTELAQQELPDAAPKAADVEETWEPHSATYILDYLLPACGGEVVVLAEDDSSYVWEQVFDEVRYSHGAVPELPRRVSRAWRAARTALHVECCRSASTTEAGELMYQIMLLQINLRALKHVRLMDVADATVPDASSQMEAARKIVLQARELEAQRETSENEQLRESARMAIQDAREAAEATLGSLREAWSSLSENEIRCVVQPGSLRFDPDRKHKLQHSSPHIKKLMLNPAPAGDCEVADPLCEPRAENRCLSHATALEAAKEAEDADLVTALFDAERWILSAWDSAVTIHAPDFRRLLTSYIDTSGALYDQDPQGQSRRILVVATMVLMVDRAACAQFPLLKEHSLGIDMNMLHDILAPHLHERQILHALEAYAEQRDSAATCPSTADPCVSDESFGVKFAKSKLQSVQAAIQQKCEWNQVKKKEEVEAAEKRHSDLCSRAKDRDILASSRACEDDVCRNAYGGTYERHSYNCWKCQQHRAADEYRSQAKQIHISLYEKLLPEDQHKQHAVVYELRQPDLLALQRDAVLLFAREIGVPQGFYSGQKQALWNEDPCLQQWRTVDVVAFSLGSTRRKFSETHYRQAHVLSHPSFVVPHGYNCVLAGDKSDENDNELVSATLTWDAEPLVKVVTDDVRYRVLDKHVSSWKRNENQAIALKSEAHVDMSLLEFETFGG